MKDNVRCPNLQGGPEGAICNVLNRFIRDMEDADIRYCMSRRYEVCSVYVLSLRGMAINFIGEGIKWETTL